MFPPAQAGGKEEPASAAISRGVLIRQSSLEAEVEFVVVEPGDMGVDSLALENGGQVFKTWSQLFSPGGVVDSDQDGVAVVDAKVAVHAAEDGGCEMRGVPGCERMVQTSAELMAGGLCEERHGCLGVADMEVESSGAFPAHLLIGVEEFFNGPFIVSIPPKDVPSLGEIQGEGFDLVSEASRREGFEVEFLGCFSCALNELAIDVVRGVAEGEISVSGAPSGPAAHKAVGRDLEQGFSEGLGVGHGSQKVEGGVAQGPLEERLDGMFVVGKNEGAIRRGRETTFPNEGAREPEAGGR